MPTFSKSSQDKLKTCHHDLQKLFNEVIKYYDCTVICGYRGEKEQNDAVENGFSKLRFPLSKHNSYPSMAIDVLPYPIKWDDREKHLHFMGFVNGIAKQMGIKLRFGIDFNNDLNFKNDSFIDNPHIELI